LGKDRRERMQLKEFIKATWREAQANSRSISIKPRMVCNDGFSMSVQGSTTHYCSPRESQDWYDSMEVGFPSEEEPLINQYAEDSNDYTGTVYGYVPVEIIQEVITKHGGIDTDKTFVSELNKLRR
jgi:hypothetical protein